MNYCVNCKYYELSAAGLTITDALGIAFHKSEKPVPLCNHPELRDVVTGQNLLCRDVRAEGNLCGPSGAMFKPEEQT